MWPIGRVIVASVDEVEVVGALETGLVDDWLFELEFDFADDLVYRRILEFILEPHIPTSIRRACGWFQFGSAFREHQRISGNDSGLVVDSQVQTLLQKIAQHRPHLFFRQPRIARNLRAQFVVLPVNGVRQSEDVLVFDSISL